jgi:cyclopropane-fatty-acyl-phospholipid synthase
MNAPDIQKGRHLTDNGESQKVRGGLFSSLFDDFLARRCNALLDRMDAGIISGTIQGSLPNGSRRLLGGRAPGPAAEMNIRNWYALVRIGWSGSVGLYDGWAAGEWDSPDPVQIFNLFVLNRKTLGDTARAASGARHAGKLLHWFRRNSKSGSKRNIEFHYDLGNDFYAAWLDDGMAYSSAIYSKDISSDDAVDKTLSLETAQGAKNNALLNRLALKDGNSVLEIGCGWGGLAVAALQTAKITYHGITLSHEQKAYADTRLSKAQFSDSAKVTITDYRDVHHQYDAIASVEMVEAVGQEYWPAYLDCISNNLKHGGRAAIQYIRIEDDIFDAYANSADFIQRYVFPGGMLISESRFRALAQERGLLWKDQQDFGLHYAETLRQWRMRFDAAAREGRLPKGFDEKFIRLWRFYLMYCEGGFLGGGINVSQVTLLKP